MNKIQNETKGSSDTIEGGSKISLATYEDFKNHQWISKFISKYKDEAILAKHAVGSLVSDFVELNKEYKNQHGRVLFTTVEGRVKTEYSFFKKLYKICCNSGQIYGITESNLSKFYSEVKDLAGVRFSCPYYDEIELAINKIIRPRLKMLGYATDLKGKFRDENYLGICLADPF